MPVFSLRDCFCNDLSYQRWQQGQTKDGNRSKALSALGAYHLDRWNAFECFVYVTITQLVPTHLVAW
jgi:hypothetical protein